MTLVHVFDVPDESEHLQRSDEAKVWKVDTSGSVGERGEQVMVVVDGLADDEGVRPCEALRYTDDDERGPLGNLTASTAIR